MLQAGDLVVVCRLEFATERVPQPSPKKQDRRAIGVAVDSREGHSLVFHLLERGREDLAHGLESGGRGETRRAAPCAACSVG